MHVMCEGLHKIISFFECFLSYSTHGVKVIANSKFGLYQLLHPNPSILDFDKIIALFQ